MLTPPSAPILPFLDYLYGVLTPVTDRLSQRSASPNHLLSTLDELARESDDAGRSSPHAILLRWAWDRFDDSMLVTSTSRPGRARELVKMFQAPEGEGKQASHNLPRAGSTPAHGGGGRTIDSRLQSAAEKDGYLDKRFYMHPHLDD